MAFAAAVHCFKHLGGHIGFGYAIGADVCLGEFSVAHIGKQAVVVVPSAANERLGFLCSVEVAVEHHCRQLEHAHAAMGNHIVHIPLVAHSFHLGQLFAEGEVYFVVFDDIMRVGVNHVWIVFGVGIVATHLVELTHIDVGAHKGAFLVLALGFHILHSPEGVEPMLKHTHARCAVDAVFGGVEQIAQFAHIHLKAYGGQQFAIVEILHHQLCKAVGMAHLQHVLHISRLQAESLLVVNRQHVKQLARTTLQFVYHVERHRHLALVGTDALLGQHNAVDGKRAQNDLSLLRPGAIFAIDALQLREHDSDVLLVQQQADEQRHAHAREVQLAGAVAVGGFYAQEKVEVVGLARKTFARHAHVLHAMVLNEAQVVGGVAKALLHVAQRHAVVVLNHACHHLLVIFQERRTVVPQR